MGAPNLIVIAFLSRNYSFRFEGRYYASIITCWRLISSERSCLEVLHRESQGEKDTEYIKDSLPLKRLIRMKLMFVPFVRG
jgi:hypothetical protein